MLFLFHFLFEDPERKKNYLREEIVKKVSTLLQEHKKFNRFSGRNQDNYRENLCLRKIVYHISLYDLTTVVKLLKENEDEIYFNPSGTHFIHVSFVLSLLQS